MATPSSMEDFDELLDELRKQAQATGLKQSDIVEALVDVRKGELN